MHILFDIFVILTLIALASYSGPTKLSVLAGETRLDDADVKRDLVEMITAHGYTVETHHVITHDGYNLTMFRLPSTKPGPHPPVYLQHGLIDSAFSWFANDPTLSLGYILSDLGYDVWAGNFRGNIFSWGHVSLDWRHDQYWRFSLDHHAAYDVPAMMDYVLNVTRARQLSYVCHSEGCQVGYISLSLHPERASVLNTMIAMAPAVYVAHQRSPLLKIASELYLPDVICNQPGPFLVEPWYIHYLCPELCKEAPLLCENLLFLLMGFDQGAWNSSRVPVYLAHEPGGTSWQNMAHWAQLVRTGDLDMFDYGTEKRNIAAYGTSKPPRYDLATVPDSIPMALFYGSHDWLSDPADVNTLLGLLPKKNMKLVREIKGYQHIDFLWATGAYDELYGDVIDMLHQYNPIK